jgi:aspartate/methionine/tyrosine aminotransferase
MIPGSMYGKCGEGYFRNTLAHPAEPLEAAMERFSNFLT